MKWRLRLSNLCLILLGLWPAAAGAQDASVDEASSTGGQDDPKEDAGGEKPHLDPHEPIICVKTAEGEELRMQCDDEAKRCLVAHPHLEIPDAREKVVARMMKPCQRAEEGALERLRQAGYEIVPALLETRPGYKRDERGRIYQTHFDLRRRLYLGVLDTVSIDSDGQARQRLSAEIGGVHEFYDPHSRRRTRHQFLVGRVTLEPLEANVLLYGYDRGRTGDEPIFRIVEFLSPEPDRYDISIHLGPGIRVGRFEFEELEGRHQFLFDAAAAHINWEVLQSDEQGLEDYVLLRGGVGGGFVDAEGIEETHVHGFPEVGLEGAWLIGERGLTQLRFEAAARWIFDESGARRDRGRANASLERVLVSINDQPISLFARAGAQYRRGPLAPDGVTSYEALVGGRLSFFVPPRPNYARME